MKWLPCILLVLQIPCYFWCFLDFDNYQVYAPLLNHFLYDSGALLLYFGLANKDWNIYNKYCYRVLLTFFAINLYAIIWGFSVMTYQAIAMTIGLLVWMGFFFWALMGLKHDGENWKID